VIGGWIMVRNHFFNAHHSPMGAFASFTLGYPGRSGGFDIEQGRPPEQNIYVGLQELGSYQFRALPFYEEEEGASGDNLISTFPLENIQRSFQVASDSWKAGDLTFTLYSPYESIPNPEIAIEEELKFNLLPAIYAEIIVDNRAGKGVRRAFFGYQGDDPYTAMRRLDDTTNGEIIGIGQGRHTAIATSDSRIKGAIHFSMEAILTQEHEENWRFGLGHASALIMDTPAGEVATYIFAICFFRDGVVSTGIDAKYFYTQYFQSIEDTARYALAIFDRKVAICSEVNQLINVSKISDDQKFMLTHAIRSYYGNTEMLVNEGKAIWIVNEGEYRMINTFDLLIDQIFFELKMNPWTVRNVLDLYLNCYRYYDKTTYPGDSTEFPGGISFTHDMGVANNFSRPEFSSYELIGMENCFSYMTHEQLVNWVLCASVYVQQSGDFEWLQKNLPIFEECFESMQNRDHENPDYRDGIMSLDSNRTLGGAEITTYDSLDTSLGQARNNIYLAGKCWAAYIALEKVFNDNGYFDLAATAGEQAERCATTIVNHANPEGYIPAIIRENNDSRIIPAIEGLIYPLYTGSPEALDSNGRYGQYIRTLNTHIQTILKVGICLFDDGGWKISSTSNNSWLSKIYLCQYISREILGCQWNEEGKRADEAHVQWLTNPEHSKWCWSDQFEAGIIIGSRYYPRGVTAILWLDEK
jgi:hypothetical protein